MCAMSCTLSSPPNWLGSANSNQSATTSVSPASDIRTNSLEPGKCRAGQDRAGLPSISPTESPDSRCSKYIASLSVAHGNALPVMAFSPPVVCPAAAYASRQALLLGLLHVEGTPVVLD